MKSIVEYTITRSSILLVSVLLPNQHCVGSGLDLRLLEPDPLSMGVNDIELTLLVALAVP